MIICQISELPPGINIRANHRIILRFYYLGLMHSKQPEMLERLSNASTSTGNFDHFPDDSFFEMLMKCQSARIEEQRSSLPNDCQVGSRKKIELTFVF